MYEMLCIALKIYEYVELKKYLFLKLFKVFEQKNNTIITSLIN